MTRRPSPLLGVIFCLWAAGLSSCLPEDVGQPVSPGPALAGPIVLEFALFYPEPPEDDPRAVLDGLLASGFGGLTLVDEVREEEIGERRVVSAIPVADARESYAAPDVEGLRHFGRGLDGAQAEALQGTDQVLRLVFGHGQEDVWTGLREANRLTLELARRTGGLIWDEETREIFGPDFWDERRVAPWTAAGPPPDLRQHFTVHVYRTESGFRRAISLGLKKIGLPDLIVEDLSGSTANSTVATINLLAQALVEGAEVGENGDLDLDLHSLGQSPLRDQRLADLEEDATARARLRLVVGAWEEGDPYNRLCEVAFDRYTGPDVQARQQAMLDELFGAGEDAAVYVEHSAGVLAASRKARERLLAFKPTFQAGLPPGEVLFVKAPFRTPDGGQEWMWVEVVKWKGARITGTLRNQPALIAGLKEGQRVEVSEGDVFDYTRDFPDGSSEGNETAKLLFPGR